jgi:hypothetical protein
MSKGLLIGLFVVCLTVAAGHAVAGDYYVYRDASGRVVLSNNAPPASGKTLKKETLPEVSDKEVAEARAREEGAAVDNRIANLERTVDDLEYRLRTQSATTADYAQPAYGNDVFVGVSSGFVWPAHRPSPRPMPNPNPMRSPAGPSSLPGGIIPGGSLPGGKMG